MVEQNNQITDQFFEEEYMRFLDDFYGVDKPQEALNRKCAYINRNLREQVPLAKQLDPNGIHFNDEELQAQIDDYVFYVFGVLAQSEERARQLAEDGDIATQVGMEITPDMAALIYRMSQQKRQEIQQTINNTPYVLKRR